MAIVPSPDSLCMCSSPCISSASRRDSTSPIPVPSMEELSAPSRLNGSNRRASFSGLMPIPVSSMPR